jgi:hypothetical protein
MIRGLLRWRVVEWLGGSKREPLTALGVIFWWEKRRWLYNLLVGLTGVAAIAAVVLIAMVTGSDCGVPDPPVVLILAAAVYGIAANVCYTFGTVAELIARATAMNATSRDYGAALFALGTIGSVLLTAAPGCAILLLCTVAQLFGAST